MIYSVCVKSLIIIMYVMIQAAVIKSHDYFEPITDHFFSPDFPAAFNVYIESMLSAETCNSIKS